jgi:hypothetical protein
VHGGIYLKFTSQHHEGKSAACCTRVVSYFVYGAWNYRVGLNVNNFCFFLVVDIFWYAWVSYEGAILLFRIFYNVTQSVQRLATGWMARGSNPVERDFPCPSWPTLRPTQPPVQYKELYNWYRVFPGVKVVYLWPPPPHLAPRLLPLWVFMAYSRVNFIQHFLMVHAVEDYSIVQLHIQCVRLYHIHVFKEFTVPLFQCRLFLKSYGWKKHPSRFIM